MYVQMAPYLLIVLNELEMSPCSHSRSTAHLCVFKYNAREWTFFKEMVPYIFRQQIFTPE